MQAERKEVGDESSVNETWRELDMQDERNVKILKAKYRLILM